MTAPLLLSGSNPTVEWAVATRAFPGASVSGDRGGVFPAEGGALLVMVDGLGHGPHAAAVADTAFAFFVGHIPGSLPSTLRSLDDALRGSRGAAVGLAWADATGRLDWLGVGNVDGMVVHADRTATPPRMAFSTRGGVVGLRPPARPTPSSHPLGRGDLVVLATDGLRSGFGGTVEVGRPPAELAAVLLDGYGRGTDDACVLVARFRGPLR